MTRRAGTHIHTRPRVRDAPTTRMAMGTYHKNHAVLKPVRSFVEQSLGSRQFLIGGLPTRIVRVFDERYLLRLRPLLRRTLAWNNPTERPVDIRQQRPRLSHCADNTFANWKAAALALVPRDDPCPKTARRVGPKYAIALFHPVLTSRLAALAPRRPLHESASDPVSICLRLRRPPASNTLMLGKAVALSACGLPRC